MTIIVHRGTHQIGGCATEIKTNTTIRMTTATDSMDIQARNVMVHAPHIPIVSSPASLPYQSNP